MNTNEKISVLADLGPLEVRKDQGGAIVVSISNCVVHDIALTKSFNIAKNDPTNWESDKRVRGMRHLKPLVAAQFKDAACPLAVSALTFDAGISALYDMAVNPQFLIEKTYSVSAGWGNADVPESSYHKFDNPNKKWVKTRKIVHEF